MAITVLQRNVIQVTARFEQASAYADPTTVNLRLKRPDGTLVSPAPVMVKISTGVYQYNLDTAGLAAGVWTYGVEGDGQVDAAAEGTFTIAASAFP